MAVVSLRRRGNEDISVGACEKRCARHTAGSTADGRFRPGCVVVRPV